MALANIRELLLQTEFGKGNDHHASRETPVTRRNRALVAVCFGVRRKPFDTPVGSANSASQHRSAHR